MNWTVSLFLLLLWIVIGRLVFSYYQLHIDKKYPPSEFNAGFFIYLIGRCVQATTPCEQIASWYLNTTMVLRNKMLVRLFDYIFWPASLTPLIIYKEFAENKKAAK